MICACNQQLLFQWTLIYRHEYCVWLIDWSLYDLRLSNDLERLRRAQVLGFFNEVGLCSSGCGCTILGLALGVVCAAAGILGRPNSTQSLRLWL